MIIWLHPILFLHSAFFVAASGHKDSVTCTGFSHDGKYMATADMGGLVQVWLTSSREKVWSFETGDIEVNTLSKSSMRNLCIYVWIVKVVQNTTDGAII